MKKILWALCLAVMALGTARAQANKVEIKFEKLSHDFGTIYEANGPVTYTFKFKNTGTGMLVIYQAVASCGCTTPVFSKEPVRPGATGEIRVTYNGAGKHPGRFDKVITLRTNTRDEFVRLKISGTMIGKEK